MRSNEKQQTDFEIFCSRWNNNFQLLLKIILCMCIHIHIFSLKEYPRQMKFLYASYSRSMVNFMELY